MKPPRITMIPARRKPNTIMKILFLILKAPMPNRPVTKMTAATMISPLDAVSLLSLNGFHASTSSVLANIYEAMNNRIPHTANRTEKAKTDVAQHSRLLPQGLTIKNLITFLYMSVVGSLFFPFF